MYVLVVKKDFVNSITKHTSNLSRVVSIYLRDTELETAGEMTDRSPINEQWIEVEGSPREEVLYFHSARSTSTTDLKANHSGISSPARSIWRNLVPESFLSE